MTNATAFRRASNQVSERASTHNGMITYMSERVHGYVTRMVMITRMITFVINHLRRSQWPRLPVGPLLGFIEIRRPEKSRARRCEPDGRAPRYTERTLRARRQAV